jgi:hypothetical protein
MGIADDVFSVGHMERREFITLLGGTAAGLPLAKHSQNLFYSGFGFAASHCGLPDVGYFAWTDILQATWRVRQILRSPRSFVA